LAGLCKLHILTCTDPGELTARHDRAKAGFRSRFPAPTGWLHDVIDGPAGDDPALRPNQLLAWSLPYAPMDDGAEPVLRAVGEQLLTPLGLRSLAPSAAGYQPEHRGGPAERDRAYHEGTIWPWLIGPYSDVVARLRTVPPQLLAGIEAHLSEWGLGSVSETADGDPPHRATGCPFQAWSVAETLRVHRKIG